MSSSDDLSELPSEALLKAPLITSMYPNDVSETFDCRICGGGASQKGNLLIQPCACIGGLSLVHAKCLLKWIELRPKDGGGGGDNNMRCEICKEEYRVRIVHKFHCNMICACRPLGYLLEMFMLIFCICCAGVMIVMVTGKPHLIDDGKISNQQIMMWILFTVIFIMAMVALKKILGRFMRAASTAEIEYFDKLDRLSATIEEKEEEENDGILIIEGEEV